jgi:AcrR family transcriptional regulator
MLTVSTGCTYKVDGVNHQVSDGSKERVEMTADPDLPVRLLTAALEALKGESADRLSLRRLAQQVGVSHQAPYVHFGGKREFLAAVAGRGLHQAADEAAAAVAQVGDDPLTRLHALVNAYVRFIESQPHVLDLVYGPMVAKDDHPALQNAAIAYWDLVHATVAACQPAGTSEADILRRCAATWGTVYGIARLTALQQVPASVPADQGELLREAVDTLFAGWQASSRRMSGGGPHP